jgi:adenylate cyclase
LAVLTIVFTVAEMPFQIWRKLGSNWRTRALLTAAIFGTGLGAARLDFSRKLEWKTEDARLKAREAFNEPAHGDLLLVGVDEASIDIFAQWPFPRTVHGFLMDWLGRSPETRPAVMGWDLLFIDRNFEVDIDRDFAKGIQAAGFPVVLGAMADPDLSHRGIQADGEPKVELAPLATVKDQPALARLPDRRAAKTPWDELREAADTAFLDADADPDGVVRRLPLVVRIGDGVYPSLVLQALIKYWKVGYKDVTILPGEALVIRRGASGTTTVPIGPDGSYRLNYRHEHASPEHPKGLRTEGYWAVYEPLMLRYQAEEATASPPPTGGKIVLVGQVASGLTDIGPSPLAGKSAKVMIHLNALDNILKGDYRRDLPLAPVLAGVLLLGLGIGWVLEKRTIPVFALLVLVAAAAIATGATGLLIGWSVMTPLAVPLAALLSQQGAFATLKVREEQAKRDRIRGMFATYVAPALVDRMVQSGEEPRLGGVEEEITAYFSDIESFSSFSEKLSPKQLVELMNEYLSACTDIVQAEGGTLDKYIGDALVAMYGAPLVLPNHGHRAVVAALRVHRRCAELRAKWKAEQAEKGWPDIVANLQTRIGLNLGRAVVGNMGSHTRFNYTMMGDTVNLAARMESGAKAYGVYTLVTESVVEASRRAEPGAVLFRPLDRIVVKGRSQPVAVFEAMALRADAEASGGRMAECATLFSEGLERYHAQHWDGARERFERSLGLEAHQKNNPSKVMLKRVELMRARPPGPDWDGVWTMESK